jgi:solute carrier family 35 protein E3
VLYNGASLINLNVNTVGFYQISKILVTPTVMLINFAMFSESTASDVKAAVMIMLVGVTMATVTDVDVSSVGLAIGLLAVVGSAQQQILIQKVQKKLGATSNQVSE